MAYTPEDEVCITTVVVKGPGASLWAAHQHELVSQAFTLPPQRLGARHGHPAMQSRTLSARGVRRPKTDPWSLLYLAASLLFFASAILFGYLAFK